MKSTERHCGSRTTLGCTGLLVLVCAWMGCVPTEGSKAEEPREVALRTGAMGLAGSTVEGSGWRSTSLKVYRYNHTATLLPSGRVLIVGGSNPTGGVLSSSVLYDAMTGAQEGTLVMVQARQNHVATLLLSGRVLVTGGTKSSSNSPSNFLASAEEYDPGDDTWTEVAHMSQARFLHTATLLPSGKVLVAGGTADGSNALSSAQVYDPGAKTWRSVDPMNHARMGHTATLLPSGNVLVAGGASGMEAEEFNPDKGTWTPRGVMRVNRSMHTATLLPSGEILVVGGTMDVRHPTESNSGLAAAEVYDPDEGTWRDSPHLMDQERLGHTATLLPAGKILVAGGRNGSPSGLASAEVYDPQDGSWSPSPSLGSGSFQHTATLLPSGKVLVTGGFGNEVLDRAEVYDPGPVGSSRDEVSMNDARSGHTVTLMPSGLPLVVGGTLDGHSPFGSTELFDTNLRSWKSMGTLDTARFNHTATLLPFGQVLVAGGRGDASNPLDSAELYDPCSESWRPATPLGTARFGHTSTLLPSGKVLVVDGTLDGPNPRHRAELYDPASNSWSPAASPSGAARSGHTATLLTLPSGQVRVLVAGGRGDASNPLDNAELYDPTNDSWSTTGPLNTPRSEHSATLLPSGQVLIAGGRNGDFALLSAELYDPGTGKWSRSSSSLATSRYAHTATLLPSGQVLISGGETHERQALVSVEVYDPALAVFNLAGALRTARFGHTATLLPSGKVLFAGGMNGTWHLASTEVYAGTVVAEDKESRPEFYSHPATKPEEKVVLTGSRLLDRFTLPLLSLTAVEGGAVTRIDKWVSASEFEFTFHLPTMLTGYYVLSVMPQGTSGGQLILVDGTPPAAPLVMAPLDEQEFFTATTLEISGTAEPRSTVVVKMDGAVDEVPTDVAGAWRYKSDKPLTLGSYSVRVTARDLAENESELSQVDIHLLAPRSHYGWHCATAPALPAGGVWLVVALLLGRRGTRRPTRRCG